MIQLARELAQQEFNRKGHHPVQSRSNRRAIRFEANTLHVVGIILQDTDLSQTGNTASAASRHAMSPGGTLVFHTQPIEHPTVTSALNRQELRTYAVRRNCAIINKSEECLELDIGQAPRSPVVSDDTRTTILDGDPARLDRVDGRTPNRPTAVLTRSVISVVGYELTLANRQTPECLMIPGVTASGGRCVNVTKQ